MDEKNIGDLNLDFDFGEIARLMDEMNSAMIELGDAVKTEMDRLNKQLEVAFLRAYAPWSEAGTIEVLVHCNACGHTLDVWPVQCPDCGAVGSVIIHYWDDTNKRLIC